MGKVTATKPNKTKASKAAKAKATKAVKKVVKKEDPAVIAEELAEWDIDTFSAAEVKPYLERLGVKDLKGSAVVLRKKLKDMLPEVEEEAEEEEAEEEEGEEEAEEEEVEEEEEDIVLTKPVRSKVVKPVQKKQSTKEIETEVDVEIAAEWTKAVPGGYLNKTYKIKGQDLAEWIHGYGVSKKDVGALLKDMKEYVVADEEAEPTEETQHDEILDELLDELAGAETPKKLAPPTKPKPAPQPKPEAPKPKAPVEKPGQTEIPSKLTVTYNKDVGAFVDSHGLFVWDKGNQQQKILPSAFGVMVNGKPSPFKVADVANLSDRTPLWHVVVKKRAKNAIPTKQEFDALIKANTKAVPAPPPKPAAPAPKKPIAPEPEPVIELDEEEDESNKVVDDEGEEGNEQENGANEEVELEGGEIEDTEGGEIEDAEGGDDGTTVEHVEKEIKQNMVATPTIDEATFAKFVNVQLGDPNVVKGDYVAISKKAGLTPEVGKEIMNHYRKLTNQFPHAVTNAVANSRKLPIKPNMGQSAQLHNPPGQRRLLQKK